LQIADYLTTEFYTEHYNLQQRIDILDVLVLAAGKLSAIRKKSEKQVKSLLERNVD